MTASEQLAQFAAGSKALPKLCREYKKERATVHLKELVGGALSFYAAAAVAKTGGVHIFVAEDRDAAAYLLNDFYNLLDEKQVYFFPSSYKRSAAYGAEDAQGVVQRTTAMNAVRGFTKGYLVVCTYPEALAERVVDAATLQRDTIAVKLGDKISIAVLEDALADANFTRVDFVYEPGQYSVRGGIVDVFSYSESKPYRIDFFGDEVETIRTFDVETQLSKEKLDSIYIVPEMSKNAKDSTSLLGSLPRNTCIAARDLAWCKERIGSVWNDDPVVADEESFADIDQMRKKLVRGEDFLREVLDFRRIHFGTRPMGTADATIHFSTQTQPIYHKNFDRRKPHDTRGIRRRYATHLLFHRPSIVRPLPQVQLEER